MIELEDLERIEEPEEPDAGKAESAAPEYVFALDIGTRDIIGIVGVPDEDKLRVEAVEVVEHPKRAMIDGQIEDIEQVGRMAVIVKERLEKRLGYTLKRVCVAAAGRALKTQRATYEVDLESPEVITDELICRLEAGAVQRAEQQFEPGTEEEDQRMFFLVGYSVVQYRLDNYPLSTLLDHRGQHVSVDLIATFLPREVVNSLYAAMRKAGLEIASLTLEPIAAINAAIPQNLRLLNLALVDIGAGTSDIAISRDGSIVAYTMATIAGDEITETIMKKYLVDFPVAESIKLHLSAEKSSEEEIAFQDILGFSHAVTADEVREVIEPVMRDLCQEIGEQILQANGGSAPSAVFLVGGGSKLPGLCRAVSEYLKMDANRVAVGGNNFSMSVAAGGEEASGPEFATPLGIALSTALNLINDSFTITLNGENAKLFRSGRLTALDVLLMNGYNYNQLISRSGQSIAIEVNGEKRVVRGTHSMPASLFINGREAKLSSIVKAGDQLDFVAAISGEDAHPCLEDLISFEYTGRVSFLDDIISLGTHALVNGEPSHPRRELAMHDRVETFEVRLLGDLLQAIGEDPDERVLLVNGGPAGLDFPLADGDVITYEDGGGHTVPDQEERTGLPFAAPQPAPVTAPEAMDAAAEETAPPLGEPEPAAVPQDDIAPEASQTNAPPAKPLDPPASPPEAPISAPIQHTTAPSAEEAGARAPLPEDSPAKPQQASEIPSLYDDAKGFTPADFLLEDDILQPSPARRPLRGIQSETGDLTAGPAAPQPAHKNAGAVPAEPTVPEAAAAPQTDAPGTPQAYSAPPAPDVPPAPRPQKAVAATPGTPRAYSAPPAPDVPPAPRPQKAVAATPGTPRAYSAPPAPGVPPAPRPDAALHFTLNGAPLTLSRKQDGVPYMLLDMLNLVDIDLSKPQGRIVLRVNGQDAPYRFELSDGDTIEIHWEKR